MLKQFFTFFILISLLSQNLIAQGIRGVIKNTNGEVLPNASIFIPELNISSSANGEGKYAVKLKDGKYTIAISFIGYSTQKIQVEIVGSWLERNVIMSDQGYLLKEVIVGLSDEDFAYSIMRKAIAKKKFHLLQLDSYEMRSYTKGTGEIINIPSLVKKKLAKEGVKAGQAYTSETVSQIKYTRPNKIEEKVISVRIHGENPNPSASPTMFVNQNFYNDKIGGNVSPLSKSAFAYYKFKYLGSFEEGENSIYKIGVIPRSKGDNIFEGTIYIIDEHWAIKGLELQTSQMGFPIKVKQQYAEIAKSVWLPITQHYTFSGKVFGFEGEFKYLVSCSNFKVQINKDLIPVDEPEKFEAVAENRDISKLDNKDELAALIRNNEKMTRRQYVKVLEAYEKESQKEKEQPKVISDRTFSIDKLAGKRDSAYWDTIRSVPLTDKEQIGYRRQDSVADKAAVKAKSDSSKSNHKFGISDLLFGHSYKLSKNVNFRLSPTITQINFNTVEGMVVDVKGSLIYQKDSTKSVLFEPLARYGFASNKPYGKACLGFKQRNGTRQNSWFLEGGEFVEQFNSDQAIQPLINTVSTLLYRRNFMKVYEKQYAAIAYTFVPSGFFSLNTSLEWAQRNGLINHSDYSFFYEKSRTFSSNVPVNAELATTTSSLNQALTFSANLSYLPLQQYRIYNGRKSALTGRSPEILFAYRKGIKTALSSDVDFDLVELGFNHSLDAWAGDRFSFELKAGSFLNNKEMYFMDYHHFDANRTGLTSIKPAGSFRLLDYYLYSTNNAYFSAHTHYSFRKFLLSRIPEVRLLGLKENIFLNYLKTSASPHYLELGYSLDNIFRFFRLEAATSFVDGKYSDFGLRLGISTAFNINTKR